MRVLPNEDETESDGQETTSIANEVLIVSSSSDSSDDEQKLKSAKSMPDQSETGIKKSTNKRLLTSGSMKEPNKSRSTNFSNTGKRSSASKVVIVETEDDDDEEEEERMLEVVLIEDESTNNNDISNANYQPEEQDEDDDDEENQIRIRPPKRQRKSIRRFMLDD